VTIINRKALPFLRIEIDHLSIRYWYGTVLMCEVCADLEGAT
jgi:hypothetical protein